METKDILKFVTMAGRRPQNSLMLKMKGIIMSVQEYEKNNGQPGFRYKLVNIETESVIDFTSSRRLKKGETAEVMLTLSGFTAYER